MRTRYLVGIMAIAPALLVAARDDFLEDALAVYRPGWLVKVSARFALALHRHRAQQ